MCSYCTLVAYKKSFAAKFIKSSGNDFLKKTVFDETFS